MGTKRWVVCYQSCTLSFAGNNLHPSLSQTGKGFTAHIFSALKLPWNFSSKSLHITVTFLCDSALKSAANPLTPNRLLHLLPHGPPGHSPWALRPGCLLLSCCSCEPAPLSPAADISHFPAVVICCMPLAGSQKWFLWSYLTAQEIVKNGSPRRQTFWKGGENRWRREDKKSKVTLTPQCLTSMSRDCHTFALRNRKGKKIVFSFIGWSSYFEKLSVWTHSSLIPWTSRNNSWTRPNLFLWLEAARTNFW